MHRSEQRLTIKTARMSQGGASQQGRKQQGREQEGVRRRDVRRRDVRRRDVRRRDVRRRDARRRDARRRDVRRRDVSSWTLLRAFVTVLAFSRTASVSTSSSSAEMESWIARSASN
jgi:hypothetical protein